MDNTQKNIEEIVALTDLIPTLEGPDADTEAGLIAYIIKTRDVIASKPGMFATQQDALQLLQMYDYLITNWDIDKVRAISILADQESKLVSGGYINYDGSDFEISDVAENIGFFSTLAEMYEEEIETLSGLYGNELDGLFKRLKARRKERKEYKRTHTKAEFKAFKKERRREIIGKLNKFNPLTLAARNALRSLLAVNILGISSKMMKNTEALNKLKKMYKGMGGKESKLMETLKKGSKKKALFNKKMQRDIESGNFKGTEGLSGWIDAALKIVGKIFKKIWGWVKKDKGEEIEPGDEEFKPGDEEFKTDDGGGQVQFYKGKPKKGGKTNDGGGKPRAGDSSDKKKKQKNVLIAVIAIVAAGGITYGVIDHNKRKKKAEEQKTLKKKIN